MAKYQRIMLKLSGEALAGGKSQGFDLRTVREVAAEVKSVRDEGVEVAIVIGGGNFWRGRTGDEIDRVRSDQIGMLATVMNSLYVSEVFRKEGLKTALFGAFEIPGIMPLFDMDAVDEAFRSGSVVFFAGGTGHPYFSTDTATALRASEIGADIILLAKHVDGVYDLDPALYPEARKFETISLREVLERELTVIDLTASQLCKERHLPLMVFRLGDPGSIRDAVSGISSGTLITAD